MTLKFVDCKLSIAGCVLKKDIKNLVAEMQGMNPHEVTQEDIRGRGFYRSHDTPVVTDEMEEYTINGNDVVLPWHSVLMKSLMRQGYCCVLKTENSNFGSEPVKCRIVIVATPEMKAPVQFLCNQFDKPYIPVEKTLDIDYMRDLHIALKHLKIHDSLPFTVGNSSHDVLKQRKLASA
jgi:hypothetical protein